VRDCFNCSIAWLHKDAQVFGHAIYLGLVGSSNVICDGVGPVLETTDEDFLQDIDACPRKA
jgi:hypothetical protein